MNFTWLLIQSATPKGLATQLVGLLAQLYSPNVFGLRDDAFKVVSPRRVHRELGHPVRGVADNLRALAEAGYIHLDFVSGERQERFSPAVRLLSDAEIVAFLGLGGVASKGGE